MFRSWVIAQNVVFPDELPELASITEDSAYKGELSVGTLFQDEAGEGETIYQVLHIFPPDVFEAIEALSVLMSKLVDLVGTDVPTNLLTGEFQVMDIRLVFTTCLDRVINSTMDHMKDTSKV